jgi:hypothetical protein
MRRLMLITLLSAVAVMFAVFLTGCQQTKEQVREEDAGSSAQVTPIISLADMALETLLRSSTDESVKDPTFVNSLKVLRDYDKEFYRAFHDDNKNWSAKYYLTRTGFSCCPCTPVKCCECPRSSTLGSYSRMDASLSLKDPSGAELEANRTLVEDVVHVFSFEEIPDGTYTLIVAAGSLPPISIDVRIDSSYIHFD